MKKPAVVALGGGTGLPIVLKALKSYTEDITAIVTVADDGGSSGVLRREMGILPPGDIRNCLVALSDDELLMGQLFQYRFQQGEGLAGHCFGNLFIAALTDITGDFVKAILESSHILDIKGRVLPSTTENVILCAELDGGGEIEGQYKIAKTEHRPIKRVYIKPENAKALPEAVEAIYRADQIIIGPGSLYTSIMPNLLISDIKNAVCNSKAKKIYICNAMTQHGETNDYTAVNHIEVLSSYLNRKALDTVIINDSDIPEEMLSEYKREGASQVFVEFNQLRRFDLELVMADVINIKKNTVRHSSEKLENVLKKVGAEKESVTTENS
ncbi:MAG: YvcK family protein [Actinobacteria bacterium]|nr:YvcK family protein [Actinomycetota bacterium]